MLRKEWMGLAFVIGLGFQVPLLAQALSIVHAEAPQFTVVATKARLSGTAVVRVRINPAGRVIASTIEKNLPMGLDKAAQVAALLWRFGPSEGGQEREALLTFLFEHRKAAEPSHDEVTFAGPLTLRLVQVHSTVLWLPRKNGEIPEKPCPVHGGALAVEQIELRKEYPRYLSFGETPEDQRREAEWKVYQEALAEAESTLFPESHSSYPATHVVFHSADREARLVCPGVYIIPEEEKEEIYYCQACRDAEKDWRESHPEPEKPEEPASASSHHPVHLPMTTQSARMVGGPW